MSIRSEASQWFKSRYGQVTEPVYSSKCYKPEESWTRTPVWFFNIPVRHIKEGNGTYIHLVCQSAPNEHSFHYLKVPAAYFRDQFSKLGFTTPEIINLHLSAELPNMFEDERGKGKVSFSRFLMV